MPGRFAADAIYEAVDAGIGTVICVAEFVPAHEMLRIYNYIRPKGITMLGPNCPGALSPGKANVGIIPAEVLSEGRIGLVSRSGTLTYQIGYELAQRGLGNSTIVGIGGDPVVGSSFIDVLGRFETDDETDVVVMVGEIGGDEEEKAARFIEAEMSKPVVAYIAGFTAPPGKTMGHAGAIISGSSGTARGEEGSARGRRSERRDDADGGRRAGGRHRRRPGLMRAAACAAVIGVAALTAGCGSHKDHSPGFADPRVIQGKVIGPDPARITEERMGVSVDFVTPAYGFLATASGRILVTKNGGRTWTATRSHVRGVYGIDFVSATQGFALTDRFVLLQTDDGGASWHRVHRFPRGSSRRADAFSRGVVFPDADDGWVTTLRGLYRTRDGGRTWAALDYPCGKYDHPVGPAFTDAANGYVVCGGQPATDMQQKSIYVTDDGGDTWKLRAGSTIFSLSRRNPLPAIGGAKGLVFRTEGSGVLTSSRGGIDRTDDGGYSWRTILFTDDVDTPVDVSWPAKDRIYALAFHAGLLRSDDGGAHWTIVYPHDRSGPYGPSAFFSPSVGLAFGARTSQAVSARSSPLTTAAGRGTSGRRSRPDSAQSGSFVSARLSSPRLLRRSFGRTTAVDTGLACSHFRGLTSAHSASFRPMSATTSTTRTAFSAPTTAARTGSSSALVPASFRVSSSRLTGRRTLSTTSRRRTPVRRQSCAERRSSSDPPMRAFLARRSCADVGGVRIMHRLDDRHWWFFALAGCSSRGSCREQVWRTADGGAHWDLIRLPREITSEFASFVTPAVGFAGSSTSGLYRTEDGGVTWRYV